MVKVKTKKQELSLAIFTAAFEDNKINLNQADQLSRLLEQNEVAEAEKLFNKLMQVSPAE